jgi:hypothetical protein
VTFIAERCQAKEREAYLEALERIQPGLRGERPQDGEYEEAEEKLLPNVRLANGATAGDTRRRLLLAFNTPFFPEVLVASSGQDPKSLSGGGVGGEEPGKVLVDPGDHVAAGADEGDRLPAAGVSRYIGAPVVARMRPQTEVNMRFIWRTRLYEDGSTCGTSA